MLTRRRARSRPGIAIVRQTVGMFAVGNPSYHNSDAR